MLTTMKLKARTPKMEFQFHNWPWLWQGANDLASQGPDSSPLGWVCELQSPPGLCPALHIHKLMILHFPPGQPTHPAFSTPSPPPAHTSSHCPPLASALSVQVGVSQNPLALSTGTRGSLYTLEITSYLISNKLSFSPSSKSSSKYFLPKNSDLSWTALHTCKPLRVLRNANTQH